MTVRIAGVPSPVTVTFDYFSELEQALSMSLNTTKNELIEVEETELTFRLTARRYGHGIGMSQRGAQQMASEDMSYEQILDFYYPGTSRVQISFTRDRLLPALDGSSWPEAGTTQTPATGDEDAIAQATVTLSTVYDVLNLRMDKSTDAGVLSGYLERFRWSDSILRFATFKLKKGALFRCKIGDN